jgi:hypothetical protein
MHERVNKRRYHLSPGHFGVMAAIAFVILGSQNRLYRANINWIYTGAGSQTVLQAIVFGLIFLWGVFAYRRWASGGLRSVRITYFVIDAFVLALLVSLMRSSNSEVAMLYLLAALAGVTICNWVRDIDVSAFVIRFLAGLASLVACTNVFFCLMGHSPRALQPSYAFPYQTFERFSLWFGSPNDLACFLSIGILLTFWLHSVSTSVKEKSFLGAMFVVDVIALLLTFSRGGEIALVVGLAVYIMIRRSRWQVVIAPMILLITLLALTCAVGIFRDRMTSLLEYQSEKSLHSRVVVTQVSEAMIADYPFQGVGLGMFAEEYSRRCGDDACPPHYTAVNNVLTLCSESGCVATGFYVIAYLMAIVLGVRKAISDHGSSAAAILAIVLIVYFLCGFFTFNLYKMFSVISWILMGMLLGDLEREGDSRITARKGRA